MAIQRVAQTSSVSGGSRSQSRGFAACRAESYKKTVQELTAKLDNVKVDDDMKTRDDTLENLCSPSRISSSRWNTRQR
ncbi:hypothetical protein J3R83DRAFT_149 [Lanmaoa asiatica]|nr:hypothetical protein J3R83DRAFT_149 [Lanmaoa asiatica]